ALMQKMITCQLGVPAIIPNLVNGKQMFHLWPMRTLNFKWRSKSVGAQEVNAVSDVIPIISAIRLGEFSNSKSQILNSILSTQSQDIFFHKNCNGGEMTRKLSNGVVEFAWYLPGGKSKDSFEDIWTLANLRGDARSHPIQLRLLEEVSSVVVVFLSVKCITENDVHPILKMLSSSHQELIFVFLDQVKTVSNEEKKTCLGFFSTLMGNKKYHLVAGKERNAASLNTDLNDKINKTLQTIKTKVNQSNLTLEKISIHAQNNGIKVDENSNCCQISKQLAGDIMTMLQQKSPESWKRDVLPLQMNFASWSEYTKKLRRMEGVDKNDMDGFRNKMHNNIQLCRKKQFDKVQDMTPIMKEIINILVNTEDNQIKMYFLQWLKLKLDARSKENLPKQEKKYHARWNTIKIKGKKGSDVNEKLTNLEIKEELSKLERSLDDLSFGLEHILREIGQVYEAIKEVRRDKYFEDLADNISKFAAELLIDGYPLEIMDGDASHLPLVWVKSVFNCLQKKLGDKKVYVISVMGIQSSGKSTLLNTMFGLTLSVSAGRCTKGVFAQLVSVDKKLYKELGYEYILVLDTEGLRAMELANIMHKHDNELASFIIGIGAVTIVNNKGENTAEIGDILQICVHAFIRMRLANKSINLQPGCYFAHQNVSDVNAEKEMLFGVRKLKDQLDDITIAAAQQENVTDIKSFSDVIEFDVNKQILYFPNLWMGDPPMAPANPSYSEKVLKLKSDVLKYPFSYQNRSGSLTFTKINERMSDLWKAILNENFVFSFRNSLEIRNFTFLEEKILEVSREFHHKVQMEMHKYTNTINSCESDFNNFKQSLLAKLENFIHQCHISFKDELDAFFDTSGDKHILIQWQAFAANKLEEMVTTLRNDEKAKISTAFDLRKAKFENLKEMDKHKDAIVTFVKNIASKEKVPITDTHSLDVMFEKEWKKFINGLSFPSIIEKKNIGNEVWRFLNEQYNQHIGIYEIHKRYGEVKIDDLDIVWMEFSVKRLFFASEKENALNDINCLTTRIKQDIQEYLEEIKDQDFSEHFLLKIKGRFDNLIWKFENNQYTYKLTKKYKVKIFSHCLLNTIPKFEKMQLDYRRENDQQKMLTRIYKPQAHTIFIGTYTQCKKEKTAALILGEFLKNAILDSLCEPLSQNISHILKANKKEFKTKKNLIKQVMYDLKKENNFTYYIKYIRDTETSLKSWIEKYVNNYCTEYTNDQSMIGREANNIFQNKVEGLIKCIENVPIKGRTDFPIWLNGFKNAAKDIIPFTNTFSNLFGMKEVEVGDINNLKDELTNYLKEIKRNQETTLSAWGINETNQLKDKPHLSISKDILGCMKQCPLCKVTCSWTIHHPGKDHHATRHYPQGISGYHWVKSNELMIESCNENVFAGERFRNTATNNEWVNYKDYRSVNDYYKSWTIAADASLDAIPYWNWVFAKFSKEFAKHYGRECNKIPSEWKTYSDAYVDKSIEEMSE
ncbi:unnamed protein product, partial [Meganyctiphanes norvegica]